MPKRRFTEADIRNITSKYVYSVSRDAAKIPNIKELVTEAIRNVSPSREIDDVDITSVILKLQKRPTISDKIIQETAKEVIDQSAVEDLKYLITRNAKQLGKAIKSAEVDRIIKQSKLDPYASSIAKIKQAVQDYFKGPKPLDSLTPAQVKDVVKTEIEKHGPSDERTIKDVTKKFLDKADPERPLDHSELQGIVTDVLTKGRSKTPGMDSTQSDGRPLPTQTRRSKEKPEKKSKHDVKQGDWVPPKDPKNPTFFEKIRLKLRRYGMKSLSRGARNWLTDSVHNVRGPSRKKLVTEGQTVAEAMIGKMFLYFYDAKWKKELPYWDKFPLIFVVELYEDGWLGLNLHYLPITLRMKLFDRLLQLANDKSLDKITKLKLSYSLLKGFSQFPEAKPCIKKYLASHVRSQLMPIDAIDWEIALFLPVEQFQKQPKEHVWKESRKIIRKAKGR